MRIPQHDCVVLNSADRVPYLILLEVIDKQAHSLKSATSIALKSPSLSNACLSSPIARSPMEYRQYVLGRRKSSVIDYKNFGDEYAVKTRTAAILLAQLYQEQQKELKNNKQLLHDSKSVGVFQTIREKIVNEMMSIEEERVKNKARVEVDVVFNENDITKVDESDPSAAVFNESWDEKKERIRKSSPYGNQENWNLISCIIKSGADLRQEKLALQIITEMDRIWRNAECPAWLHCYRVLVFSNESGLIETIQDSISVHSIKKQGISASRDFSLYDYFIQKFGDPETETFQEAQDNFKASLAGYCVACYILAVKDRHNGNILISKTGHLIHIDFGFMLSNSPGQVGFELAPFKLTQEYIDILDGVDSVKFQEFRILVVEAFLELRRHIDEIMLLVEIMECGSDLACFTGSVKPIETVKVEPFRNSVSSDIIPPSTGNMITTSKENAVSAAMRARFYPELREEKVVELVNGMIDSSSNNMFTRLYDTFQYYSANVFN